MIWNLLYLQKYGLSQRGLIKPETGDEVKMLSLVENDPNGKLAAIQPQHVFINSFLKNQQVQRKLLIKNSLLMINSSGWTIISCWKIRINLYTLTVEIL